MLDRVDRVQVAVSNMEKAAKAYVSILGAKIARKEPSGYLGAKRTILAVGESEIELCEPDGACLWTFHCHIAIRAALPGRAG